MQATPTQDQLFTRLILVSMLTGILVGIVLTLAVLNLGIDIIFPCSALALGAGSLLGRKLWALRRQLQAPGQPAKGTEATLELGNLIFGIYFLILGSALVGAEIFPRSVAGVVAALLIAGGFPFSAVLWAVLDSRLRKEKQQQAIQEPAPRVER